MHKNKNILKTCLKFHQREGSRNMVSFVTQASNKAWRGCKENSPEPKRVVVLGNVPSAFVKEGVLYKCVLVPMRSGAGFVATSATPMKFNATLSAKGIGAEARIDVSFGNCTITYQPGSKDPKLNNRNTVLERIAKRNDIRNIEETISDFMEAADNMKAVN